MLDSCARFEVERPRKSRLFVRRVFSILWKIYESSIAITETCFPLEKLKLRGKLDLDRISLEIEIIIRTNFDFIFYDNNINFLTIRIYSNSNYYFNLKHCSKRFRNFELFEIFISDPYYKK